jgi:hypothetical protein
VVWLHIAYDYRKRRAIPMFEKCAVQRKNSLRLGGLLEYGREVFRIPKKNERDFPRVGSRARKRIDCAVYSGYLVGMPNSSIFR